MQGKASETTVKSVEEIAEWLSHNLSWREVWKEADEIAKRGRAGVMLATRLLEHHAGSVKVLGCLVLGRVDPYDDALVSIATCELFRVLGEPPGSLPQEVVSTAAVSLARLPNTSALDRLMALRGSERAGVRLAVVLSLLHWGDGEDALRELVGDETDEVASWAAYSLSRRSQLEPPTVAALTELAEAVERPDARREAILALASLPSQLIDKEAYRASMVQYLENGIVDDDILNAVARRPDPAFYDALEALVPQDPEELDSELALAIQRCGQAVPEGTA